MPRHSRIELEFGNVGFEERGNWSTRRKTSQNRVQITNSKLNPHMMLGLGIKPGIHWWEASGLATPLSLLPAYFINKYSCEYLTHLQVLLQRSPGKGKCVMNQNQLKKNSTTYTNANASVRLSELSYAISPQISTSILMKMLQSDWLILVNEHFIEIPGS